MAAVRSLLIGLALLLIVSVLLFTGVEVLPGDVATQILGQNATPERVELLRQQLSLDDPAPLRWARWVGGVLSGDLGESATTGSSVSALLVPAARNTAVLAGFAFFGVVLLALGLGVLAGRQEGRPGDAALSTAALVAVSVPEFVLAGLLVTGPALAWRWLPAVSLVPSGGSPLDRPEILVLPVLSIAVVGGAFAARLVRAVVADAYRAPHVEAVRLAGVSERRVLTRHVLPSVVGPLAQVLAFTVPYLVGGTVVVERLFSYPGLGSLLVQQVAQRDAPVVEAVGLTLAGVVVLAFVLADLVSALSALPRQAVGGAS
jgi:peptide/nickel transport system permease protein